MAWHALAVLRLRESVSVRLLARRRHESEAQQPHEPALSELLLRRWRSGDWTVAPEDLPAHAEEDREAWEIRASRTGVLHIES